MGTVLERDSWVRKGGGAKGVMGIEVGNTGLSRPKPEKG